MYSLLIVESLPVKTILYACYRCHAAAIKDGIIIYCARGSWLSGENSENPMHAPNCNIIISKAIAWGVALPD
jgi:hypothetical protein